MNYGELKQAVLDDTHRGDLLPHVSRFVRQCEGMIRRELTGYLLNGKLTESSRFFEGIYTLPSGVLQIRSIPFPGRQGDSLTQVALSSIDRLDAAADVLQYAVPGDGTVIFRGVPPANTIFNFYFVGVPSPFANDLDLNNLLTDHESIYMAGSKFFLYLHTQDRELANDELDIFHGIVATLNEQAARQIGGAAVTPTYNFSGGSAY